MGFTSEDLELMQKNILKSRLDGKDKIAPKTKSTKKVRTEKAISKIVNNRLLSEGYVVHIELKPLSVNEAWQGKRFKTKKYKEYSKKLAALLPFLPKLPSPPYRINLTWGFGNSASDFDNPVKTTVDILSKIYGFNDKLIHQSLITKKKVEKGKDYLEFQILHYTE